MSPARYGGRWDPVRLRLVHEISEAEARHRYVDGPTFVVVIAHEGEDVPPAVLEVDAGASRVLVSFYGAGGALDWTCLFRRRGSRLFPEQIDTYTYADERLVDELGADLQVLATYRPANVVRHEVYWLRPDGVGRLVVDDADNSGIEAEDRTDIPVDDTWTDVPVFGEWDDLVRSERQA